MYPEYDHSNHDQLFKELLQNFLPEFLLLVAPRQAQHLKLEHGEFLNQDLTKNDPLAAALAALMRFKSGTTVEHKVRCLKGIAVNRNLNAAKSFQLANLVGKYLPLRENDQGLFQSLVSLEENKEVEDMNMAWARRLYSEGQESGLKQGEEIGRKQGRLEGTRATLLRRLQIRFGELPKEAKAIIMRCDDPARLKQWSEQVLTAPDLIAMSLSH